MEKIRGWKIQVPRRCPAQLPSGQGVGLGAWTLELCGFMGKWAFEFLV